MALVIEYRFAVGDKVLCNLGDAGWKLGTIIALNYRETTWPEEFFAPYQVLVDDDKSLIYVPEDDDRFCRQAMPEDIRILQRSDALAKFQSTGLMDGEHSTVGERMNNLSCNQDANGLGYESYRSGRCHCCNDCPNQWSYVELYSEHYRCASRNNLNITQYEIDLGVLSVGDQLMFTPENFPNCRTGFMQAPTLVRLPPGIVFSDDGSLNGIVRFDPHRESAYSVEFVAVSTVDWMDETIGIVRLEVNFEVQQNLPPNDFDVKSFTKRQSKARSKAVEVLNNLNDIWGLWERNELATRAVCDRMLKELKKLKDIAEQNPRLDNGRWWAHLGGFHMNVHKLLENTLYECELYLGYALTFGDSGVKYYAEQNLNGCYQKRLLEAARFMWYDGMECILQGRWDEAISILKAAASKKDGWGWAVNHGDIWLCEATAVVLKGLENEQNTSIENDNDWMDTAESLLQKAIERSEESGVFGPEGHPWIHQVSQALESYKQLHSNGDVTKEWFEEFNSQTIFWCSQALAGIAPFPPKCRERVVDEATLLSQLPGHNA